MHNWLDTHHADADRSAREASAEAWLDKGMAALEAAKFKDGNLCPNAAKAIAQECARRAAIRNPRYRDKAQVELEVKESPLSNFLRQIQDRGSALPIASGMVFDHEPD